MCGPFLFLDGWGPHPAKPKEKTAAILRDAAALFFGWMGSLALQHHFLRGLRNAIGDQLYHVDAC